jgi:hypothetical protein
MGDFQREYDKKATMLLEAPKEFGMVELIK